MSGQLVPGRVYTALLAYRSALQAASSAWLDYCAACTCNAHDNAEASRLEKVRNACCAAVDAARTRLDEAVRAPWEVP